ncbi:MFS transporter [uncultured Parasphingopyxis sp.]|uniref:MFS transporter n=1 Tax=uncultured Parasphingopyxis sp. TaxID=1547918 RepID=UPI002622EA1F|nr:MFS transporter [uncultured Parasphingopyxis sp.]
MQISLALLGKRRFGPLFSTQMLGAFNDNLFKFAMVVLVIYEIYNDPAAEFQFSAVTTGLFILPFFLFSAMAGQLADNHDKAKIIRIVKTAEILIAIVGAAGLVLQSIPLMLTALFALGAQSTFFGPIKYALLPQHLPKEEVLGGTGLVEAGTYIAILCGTILGGVIVDWWGAPTAAVFVLVVALIGRVSAQFVPPAPPHKAPEPIDWNVVRSSYRLIYGTLHIRRLFLAIIAISFFWTIGAVLIIQFPPLVKNVLTADPTVASLFMGIFSIGIAIGSILINRLLKGEVSARFAPVSVIVMGCFVLLLWVMCRQWQGLEGGALYDFGTFMRAPGAWFVVGALLGVAVFGGMFVVPLYAFITTTVDISQTARTVAANNVVNSGAMVLGSLAAFGLSSLGVSTTEQLFLVAAMCLVSAWTAWLLHKACDIPLPHEASAEAAE